MGAAAPRSAGLRLPLPRLATAARPTGLRSLVLAGLRAARPARSRRAALRCGPAVPP
ncbi:hypothetical protein ACFC4C_39810 [Streptomyces sp. NPDC056039]|uniref:hypothetical protein n=1 Tax=Streptomyces sp. NPDC056039 TaxID=3345687 RepID=UPI0035D8B78F